VCFRGATSPVASEPHKPDTRAAHFENKFRQKSGSAGSSRIRSSGPFCFSELFAFFVVHFLPLAAFSSLDFSNSLAFQRDFLNAPFAPLDASFPCLCRLCQPCVRHLLRSASFSRPSETKKVKKRCPFVSLSVLFCPFVSLCVPLCSFTQGAPSERHTCCGRLYPFWRVAPAPVFFKDHKLARSPQSSQVWVTPHSALIPPFPGLSCARGT
jgi:hypothetical protein